MNESDARIRLDRDHGAPQDIQRDELRELHRILVDEYRFQVKLNSDRIQIYLVLSAAILTAGTGLLKVGGTNTRALVAMIFVVGFFVGDIAIRAVRQGHDYYRKIVYKKTLVEDLLGRHRHIEGFQGANLSIETTSGMTHVREILDSPGAWLARGITPGTITAGLIRVFRFVQVINGVAALLVIAVTAVEVFGVW